MSIINYERKVVHFIVIIEHYFCSNLNTHYYLYFSVLDRILLNFLCVLKTDDKSTKIECNLNNEVVIHVDQIHSQTQFSIIKILIYLDIE